MCGLNVLSSLATSSDAVSEELLTQHMLARLLQLVRNGAPHPKLVDVQHTCLHMYGSYVKRAACPNLCCQSRGLLRGGLAHCWCVWRHTIA